MPIEAKLGTGEVKGFSNGVNGSSGTGGSILNQEWP